MEINKAERFNPLMYDIKDDNIRKITYTAKDQKISGYPFHYGALPQTWENPIKLDKHTKLPGDNDPVDAFDISEIPTKPGDVNEVKILGAIAMIDNNETDWKIIVINAKDKNSLYFNNVNDIPKKTIDIIYDFLLNYKTSEGKPQNKFYEKIFWDKKAAVNIVEELHGNWKELCFNRNNILHDLENSHKKNTKDLPLCVR